MTSLSTQPPASYDSVDKHVTSLTGHTSNVFSVVTVTQLVQYTRDQLMTLICADLPTDTVCSHTRHLFHHRVVQATM